MNDYLPKFLLAKFKMTPRGSNSVAKNSSFLEPLRGLDFVLQEASRLPTHSSLLVAFNSDKVCLHTFDANFGTWVKTKPKKI